MEKLSFTMENYLEAIYELSSENTGARVSDISSRLGVTKASVNSAVSTLAEKGLVINEKYKEVFLTPAGRALAESTSQKHHIIRKFLTDVLKVNKNIANKDACAIEHVISKESVRAMQEYLLKNKVDLSGNINHSGEAYPADKAKPCDERRVDEVGKANCIKNCEGNL